jgi:hypothetical protein
MLCAFSNGTALLGVISSALLTSSDNRYDSLTMQVLCGAITVLPPACCFSRSIWAFGAQCGDLPSDLFENPSAHGEDSADSGFA